MAYVQPIFYIVCYDPHWILLLPKGLDDFRGEQGRRKPSDAGNHTRDVGFYHCGYYHYKRCIDRILSDDGSTGSGNDAVWLFDAMVWKVEKTGQSFVGYAGYYDRIFE